MANRRRFTAVISYSRPDSTLRRARQLIQLAEQSPGPASATLCSCASILLAAVLEQATIARLSFAAASMAADDGVSYAETPYAELLDQSLRQRVLRLPNLLSSGELDLDSRNPHVSAIHSLITVRNGLCHQRDDALTIHENDPGVTIQDDIASIAIKLPDDPWGSVSLGDARRFEAAVSTYVQEVVFPENGWVPGGELLRRLRPT